LAIAVAVGALAALLPLGLSGASAATASLFDFPCASADSTTGDFDNDGTDDLAVGAPGDDLEQIEVDGSITEGVADAGSISVTYSSAGAEGGLDPAISPSATTRKFFSQDTPGIQGLGEKEDQYGFALAAGNFDGVGGDDLAIGVPGEDDGMGVVQILYSGPRLAPTSPTNFRTSGLGVGLPGRAFNQFITQNSPGVEGIAEKGDAFGYALAAADLNQDGFEDLIIGSPREDVGTRKDAGSVNVIYGDDSGLNPLARSASVSSGQLADQLFDQGSGQVRSVEIGRAEPGDFFGASITVGQFNNHPAVDVAIGSPGEDLRTVPDAGAVSVLYSRGSIGLSRLNTDFFHTGQTDIKGGPESGDRFGCALAGGDYDADFDSDLAIGSPGESIGTDKNAGMVTVIYNSRLSTGLTSNPATVPLGGTFWQEDQVWTEDEGGVPGVTKPDDRFGASLVAADFDNDNVGDLAVGLPTEQLFTHKAAGSVRVLYGFNGGGLTDSQPSAFGQSPHELPSQCLLLGIIDDLNPPIPLPECILTGDILGSQDYSPLLMVEEEGDKLGSSLAAGDFNNDGEDDLAMGTPGEDLGLFVNWLTEEEATVPDELVTQLGVPVPLSVDEAPDAGVVNIVYGPFPVPTDPPARQDLLYREGNSPFGSLRGVLHTLLGTSILQDNQIHPDVADPSLSRVLDGDGFGTSQS
jgi:hypothetical protein